MTDNRMTELLRKLRKMLDGCRRTETVGFDTYWITADALDSSLDELEQAIAATLGRPKAKSHPYGYERDTGAYDCTRCECNDCGGEIEIDEYAEKEFYEYNRPSVFVLKHDDGTLEFGGKRYVAATLGSATLTAEQVSKAVYAHSIHADCADADWQAIADELNAELGSGACENVGGSYGSHRFTCSECGESLELAEWAFVKFCHNCGRKVVKNG